MNNALYNFPLPQNEPVLATYHKVTEREINMAIEAELKTHHI